jgi:ribosomal protein S18 acetylase RimI-like enzyme
MVDAWWGREVLPGLTRLFLNHFWSTSFIATEHDDIVGFLVGFHSPSQPGEAYVHWVGVDPAYRRSGLARSLYDRFFRQASQSGCSVVRAITTPANDASIRFHSVLGFDVSPPVADYNGPGRDMVTFAYTLPDVGPPPE